MATSNIKPIKIVDIEGKTLCECRVNIADPAFIERAVAWEAKHEAGELSLPRGKEALSGEGYEAMGAFVLAILGQEQFDNIFNPDEPDIYLMMTVVKAVSPVFLEAMKKAKAFSEMFD